VTQEKVRNLQVGEESEASQWSISDKMSSTDPNAGSSATADGTVVAYKNPTNTLALLKPSDVVINNIKRSVISLKIDVKGLKQIYDNLKVDEIQAFVKKTEAVTGTEILSIVGSLFDFMGFDPEIVIKCLFAMNKWYQTQKLDPPETEDTLREDIILCVACNNKIGNLQFRAVGRRSEEGRAVIGYLQSKYGIFIGSTGAGMPSTLLTFPRIANSFPVLTVRTAIAMPIDDNQVSSFSANLLPPAARVSAFSSFLHPDLEERTRLSLLRAACAFSCDYQLTVHEGEMIKLKLKKADNVFTAEDAWNKQWNYFVVSSTSKVPELKMKRAMLMELKVREWWQIVKTINAEITTIRDDKFLVPDQSVYEKDIDDFVSGKSQKSIQAPPST